VDVDSVLVCDLCIVFVEHGVVRRAGVALESVLLTPLAFEGQPASKSGSGGAI